MRFLATLARTARGLAARFAGAPAGQDPSPRRTTAVAPREYAATAAGCFHRELRPRHSASAPLPRNVARRDSLPRQRRPWGFSFHDVPARAIDPRSVARLPACRILPYRDRWGTAYHAILTADGRRLRLHGTAVPPDASAVGADARETELGEAAWIVGRWHRNYYHWLLYHLPKILVLQAHGADRSLLVPGAGRLRPVIEASLRGLGIDPAALRSLPAGPARADPLWTVEADRFDPELLRELRRRLAGAGAPASERVHVSRQRARKRRLENDAELERTLVDAGVATVDAEALPFAEQVALASRTSVMLGVHGAGLTNMLFMPEGGHVVELANPRYPSPAFYALASALGLRYWLVWGNPSNARGSDALDVSVDPREVERVLAAIRAEQA